MFVDDLAKLSHRSRKAVSAALIVITAIALYNWIVTPHVSYLRAAQRYESAVRNIVGASKDISSAVRIKKDKLQQLREQSAQLQSALFRSAKAREFFSDLRPLCEEADCTVHSLRLDAPGQGIRGKPAGAGKPENLLGIVANRATLSITGLYGNVIRLMERLQMRAEKVRIESLSMQVSDDKSDRIECDMTIIIYSVQNEEAAP
jgi:hypothetical protein